MEVNKIDKNKCCGCTACQNTCLVKAITMEEDKEGFLYPVIDEKRCIQCGKCNEVCQIFLEKNSCDKAVQKIYAAKHRNENIVEKSSSGGIFTALSDMILAKGGVVYGTILSDNFEVCYLRAVSKEERDCMRGSKYVQSNLGDTFSLVKEDLLQNRDVLFIGSSCYCAALLQYLKQCDTSKLVTCDFVCHGVPSPMLWREYLTYLEMENNDKIIQFEFRNKKRGWRHNHYMIQYTQKTCYEGWGIQKWSKLFGSDRILRPVCYECKYASYEKPADVTIGDFFGIIEKYPEFDDNTGVSFFMVNTPKGKKLFDSIAKEIDFKEVSKKVSLQPNLLRPSVRPKDRELFWEEYYKFGFETVIKKYTKPTLKEKVEWKIAVPILQKVGCYMYFVKFLSRVRNLIKR